MSNTPILTPKERIAHAVQIASGLLASGHYTEANCGDYTPVPRSDNQEGGLCVIADAFWIADAIVKEGAK